MNNPNDHVEPNRYIGEVSEYAVIINSNGEILLIQHNGGGDSSSIHYGKWHMPGGRLNMDDEPQEGLKREILEETGLTDVDIIMPCHTSRWGFGKPVKYSVAYLAYVNGRPDVHLPASERAMAYRWFQPSELASLRFLSEKHFDVITGVLHWAEKLGFIRGTGLNNGLGSPGFEVPKLGCG